jgi:two-component system, cell cycle response regulator DivK
MHAPYKLSNSSAKDQRWVGKWVLIVEDTLDNFLFLKVLFNGYGLNLLHASTAQEAMELFHANSQIDLVLMDIMLPDDTGLNLTRRLKKLKPELVIVAQTAYAMAEDRQECLDAGCDDYLAKPINSKQLLELMNSYLS